MSDTLPPRRLSCENRTGPYIVVCDLVLELSPKNVDKNQQQTSFFVPVKHVTCKMKCATKSL